MIFELDNVELYFKNKRILNGIYLKSQTGMVTGILGSNGSGKSCLLEILFGNLKPKYHLVRIDNTPYLKPLYQSNKVAYLPQYQLIPKFFKVKAAFKHYEVDWDTFIALFDGFTQYANKRFKDLSGGERRLIETYLILKKRSELIILDEPFSHLEPIHTEAVMKLIIKEKQSKAVIVSDHRYQTIIDLSDSLYLLKNGCTKEIKDLKELEDYNYLNEGQLI